MKTRLFKVVADEVVTSKLFCRPGCLVSVHTTGYPEFFQVGVVELTDSTQINKIRRKKLFFIFT
jgi:hypothetical protein